MRIQRVFCLTISAGLVFAAANEAMAAKMMHKMCSDKMMEACIVEKGGMKHSAMTSQCLAAKWGAKVVHAGPCKW